MINHRTFLPQSQSFLILLPLMSVEIELPDMSKVTLDSLTLPLIPWMNICYLRTDRTVVAVLGWISPFDKSCFCYRSSSTTGARPYHLTFTSSCLLSLFTGGIVATKSIPINSGLSEFCCLCLQRRKLESCETMWHVPSIPHADVLRLSCRLFFLLPHPASICVCGQPDRWCRASVSFNLSRCSTWDMYQNIKTCFVMLGLVIAC